MLLKDHDSSLDAVSALKANYLMGMDDWSVNKNIEPENILAQAKVADSP